jgi:hypothetical protein
MGCCLCKSRCEGALRTAGVRPADRRGLVFCIEGLVWGKPIDTQRASRIISNIGEAAGIVIDPNDLHPREVEVVVESTGEKSVETVMVPRYATAHDLWRAFGTRWSKRVIPATLQKLMRHASIETTMRHYIQHRADDVSANLWAWASSERGRSDVAAQENAPAPRHQPRRLRRNLLACNALLSGGQGTRTPNRFPGT